jgi:hypothetical protein
MTEGRNDGMTEGRNDGRTEGRNRVTLYAPAITWRGHKKIQELPMWNKRIFTGIFLSFGLHLYKYVNFNAELTLVSTLYSL